MSHAHVPVLCSLWAAGLMRVSAQQLASLGTASPFMPAKLCLYSHTGIPKINGGQP